MYCYSWTAVQNKYKEHIQKDLKSFVVILEQLPGNH